MTTDATVRQLLIACNSTAVATSINSYNRLNDLPPTMKILEANPHEQVVIICAASSNAAYYNALRFNTLHLLCKRKLPYTVEDVKTVLSNLSQVQSICVLPFQSLLRALCRPLSDPNILNACRSELAQLREAVASWPTSEDKRKFLYLLDEIDMGQQKNSIIIHSDAWGDLVKSLLIAMDDDARLRWLALLSHCTSVTTSKPTAKWLLQACKLIEQLGEDRFYQYVVAWLDAFASIDKTATVSDDNNMTVLKGLVCCCASQQSQHALSDSLTVTLGSVAIVGYRKLPGIGPRSAKVAGACIYTLKHMPGLLSIAQLERIRLNVKQPHYLMLLGKALDEVASDRGMKRAEIEELTVPTFDLMQEHARIPVGPAIVDISIVGSSVQVQWFNEAGKACKVVPASVKQVYKGELKNIAKLREDIAHTLASQRDRLERLPLSERRWTFAIWQARYLDHPLISTLTRRLIWCFSDHGETLTGMWVDGQLVDAFDHKLVLSDDATVSAWHPALCPASTVLAWREWLLRHEITQPFKQAHREVYLLTDAERNTGIYSNRFAAHILRQHQFNALAAARGWHNTLRLMVDDYNPPASLDLPQWGLRAEFWIKPLGDVYGRDANATGTYFYVTTDQVRFYPIDALKNYAHASGGGYSTARWRAEQRESQPIPLDQIPPLVFSEVMRDVDLFVGVASVGNDPTWHDGGPEGAYRDYWQEYSFGALSASAEIRKELLSSIIPNLAIADRCMISGHFIVVRGTISTYKIHMGSGNILMEPNDQYLCIVPGPDLYITNSASGSKSSPSPNNLFLPFEGDTMLSVILSKVFLLADDIHITDSSILSQIHR